MLEALMHAIRDGAIVEERGEDLVHRLQHGRRAAHVEKRLLLTGKGSFRQILRGGGGAHRDGNLSIAAHARERAHYRRFERGRKGRRHDGLSDVRAGRRELIHVVDVEAGECLGDARGKSALHEEVAKRLGGRCEASRNMHAERGELSDHLAERCIFAADRLDVAHRQVFKWHDVGVQSDSSKTALTRATKQDSML